MVIMLVIALLCLHIVLILVNYFQLMSLLSGSFRSRKKQILVLCNCSMVSVLPHLKALTGTALYVDRMFSCQLNLKVSLFRLKMSSTPLAEAEEDVFGE